MTASRAAITTRYNVINAVLIDLDGTLADTMPALKAGYCEFLSRHGSKGCNAEFDSMIGPSLPEIIAVLKRNHGLRGDGQLLLSEYESLLS